MSAFGVGDPSAGMERRYRDVDVGYQGCTARGGLLRQMLLKIKTPHDPSCVVGRKVWTPGA
ncbi:MAG: hypothetical protein DMG13_10145 [Acidobacteria bacterium]|nr:MAG: hypothetical protein DMG13_10145 [Acidobacteriota bacterium]